MKRRLTTVIKQKQPLSTKLGRGLIFASALIMVVATPIQLTQPANADQYDDQIAALQQQIDSANAQVAALKGQESTYQTAIAGLNAQITTIQDQIAISTAQYNQLTQKIADTQSQIKDNQDALGQTLSDLYVDGNTSTLEMLASSKNISDYLNKQEYQASISNQLSATIDQITTLEKQLVQQQTDAKATLVNQQASNDALLSTQQQQQALLNSTQGQESAYESQISANQSKQQQLAAQQLAAMAATYKSTGGATLLKSGAAASGGYPWNNANCPMDGWMSTGGADGNGGDGMGYGCRQCASYAAWRMDKETGFYPVNWGNAINFPSRAQAAGYTVNGTPSAGSLAVMSVGQSGNADGHIAWVEAVSGNQIIVSQYNANYNGIGWGNYSEMEMSASAFTWYIHVSA